MTVQSIRRALLPVLVTAVIWGCSSDGAEEGADDSTSAFSSCTDNNPCTDDVRVGRRKCSYTPVSDGTACPGGACTSGRCVASAADAAADATASACTGAS